MSAGRCTTPNDAEILYLLHLCRRHQEYIRFLEEFWVRGKFLLLRLSRIGNRAEVDNDKRLFRRNAFRREIGDCTVSKGKSGRSLMRSAAASFSALPASILTAKYADRRDNHTDQHKENEAFHIQDFGKNAIFDGSLLYSPFFFSPYFSAMQTTYHLNATNLTPDFVQSVKALWYQAD